MGSPRPRDRPCPRQHDLGWDIWAGDLRAPKGSRELGADSFLPRYSRARDLVGFRACVWIRTKGPDLVWDRRQRLGTLDRRREDLEELGVWAAGPWVAVRRAQPDRDARRH